MKKFSFLFLSLSTISVQAYANDLEKCEKAIKGGQTQLAKLFCEISAKQGEKIAQFHYATLLEKDSPKEALVWFERSAKAAYLPALSKMIEHYRDKPEKAEIFQRTACKLGEITACNQLQAVENAQKNAKEQEAQKAALQAEQEKLKAELAAEQEKFKKELEQERAKLKAEQTKLAEAKRKQALDNPSLSESNKLANFDPKNYRFDEGLARFKHNELYGYVNDKGEIIIPARFSNAGAFSENIAAVREPNQKWGYINKQGQYIVRPKYDCAWRFTEGRAAVNLGGYYTINKCDGGLWGFIDKNGKEVISLVFKSVDLFKDGKAKVQYIQQEGNISTEYNVILDKQGNIIERLEMNSQDNQGNKASAYQYYEGLVKFQINGNWGYINEKGDIAIEPRFKYTANFYEGLAAVQDWSGKWGYINKFGNYVIHPIYSCVGRFSEGIAGVYVKTDYSIQGDCSGGKWGYIDKTGRYLLDPVLDNAGRFINGKANAEYQGRKGIINKRFEWVK
ncbi:WG repeat protein [Cricetibacter osteomyelitidis]|uniref:WG repeat protein n=1 Tax=Cricetibacter osteomyelitidis TaxID=1521931 RepID=A0A4R2TEZ0_9PAST|nr:WG repeat-containing protein [Cricetibacter osteomyelitidis]TCP93272.1 WG repeat protein [Cricetibacter osteomyelitidis]